MSKKDFFRGLSFFAMFVAIAPIILHVPPFNLNPALDHSAPFALLAIWAEIIAWRQH